MRRPGRRRSALGFRLASSLLAASLGAAAGYLYARFWMPPRLADHGGFMGMYVTAGAAVGLVTMRLATLGWAILRDWRDS